MSHLQIASPVLLKSEWLCSAALIKFVARDSASCVHGLSPLCRGAKRSGADGADWLDNRNLGQVHVGSHTLSTLFNIQASKDIIRGSDHGKKAVAARASLSLFLFVTELRIYINLILKWYCKVSGLPKLSFLAAERMNFRSRWSDTL